jgi:hypothetical protein
MSDTSATVSAKVGIHVVLWVKNAQLVSIDKPEISNSATSSQCFFDVCWHRRLLHPGRQRLRHRSTNIELVINPITATTLGFKIPEEFLLRANEVI